MAVEQTIRYCGTLVKVWTSSIWFDNDQSLSPVAPATGKDHPEKTITGTKLRSFGRPFHSGQLLAKRKVLQNDIKSLFESEKNVKEQVQRHLHHG